MVRPSLAGMLFCLACTSCNRERHEGLVAVLRGPVADLSCAAEPFKECGGCNAWSLTRRAANQGKDAVKASIPLAALAPFPDPETEALLVVVRQAAQEVQTALGTACPATLEVTASYSAPTDAVSACAKAANENRGSISKLLRSVSHLRERTKERTGVRLPNPNNPCES